MLEDLWETGSGCLSIQVLQEFYVNITQKARHTLGPEAAAQLIADFSAWQFHQLAVNDTLNAIRLQGRYRISFWDAMLLQSANALGCKIVWSEDLSHRQRYGNVTVRNPFI